MYTKTKFKRVLTKTQKIMRKCTIFLIMVMVTWNLALAQNDTIYNEENLQVLTYELPSSSLTMKGQLISKQLQIINQNKVLSMYVPCIQGGTEIPFGGNITTFSIEGNIMTIEGQSKAFNRTFIVIFRLNKNEKIKFEEFYKKTK